jgi:hypothetical protein
MGNDAVNLLIKVQKMSLFTVCSVDEEQMASGLW